MNLWFGGAIPAVLCLPYFRQRAKSRKAVFAPCGRLKTRFLTVYRRSLRLNVLYCSFGVLTPGDPDHDVRCTSWALRSSGVVCMLEGCVTVMPRASNSLFTQRQ